MYSSPIVRVLILAAITLLGSGCNISDDLVPSDTDKRPAITPGTTGNYPEQQVEDFTVSDSLNQPFTLADHLADGATPADAVVLYFTMWCPICLGHSDHMVYSVIPQFADRGSVRYVLVDYVSGSVTVTRAQEIANGYGTGPFTTLADVDLKVFGQFDAAMGTTVVIDANGTIRMNEDYKDGTKLAAVLESLLP